MLQQNQNNSNAHITSEVHPTPGQEIMAERVGTTALETSVEGAHPVNSGGEERRPLMVVGRPMTPAKILLDGTRVPFGSPSSDDASEGTYVQPGTVISPQVSGDATRRLESDGSNADLSLTQLEQEFPVQRKDPL